MNNVILKSIIKIVPYFKIHKFECVFFNFSIGAHNIV